MYPVSRGAISWFGHRKAVIPGTLRFQSSSSEDRFKVVVIGGGSAGLSIAHQIWDRFKIGGRQLNKGDIALLDAAEYHYYQPGWTLVGAGLRQKATTRRPLASLIPGHITHVPEYVDSFSPTSSSISTTSGRTITYDALVVAAGLGINWNAIDGLPKALVDPSSGVSSIYSYNTCDKAWSDIEALRSGNAIFTQPAGVIKCAGGECGSVTIYFPGTNALKPAPQKIMWMAWDRYRRTGRRDNIKIDFYTGMPTMFSVKKYSDALDALRLQRGVGGYFQHNLTAIDTQNHKAVFTKADRSTIAVDYTLLHVTPPMGPLDVIKRSPIADANGWVDVNQETLQHVNPAYTNVFASGDCSSLPTSKTAAAITAQAPVLTENLYSLMTTGKVGNARYDGYTSCPLLTGYGELMLAEFMYGLVPKESFTFLGDQAKSRRLFYHLKKDVFPWVYWNAMVKGQWFGTAGVVRPSYKLLTVL